MNTNTQESFQKYERKSSKRKCADHYETGESVLQTSANKKKKCGYSEMRDMKRYSEWEMN